LDNQPEINFLRQETNFTEAEDIWHNDAGQMVLAKVTIGNKIYQIANKTDLLVVEKQLTLDRMTAMGVVDAVTKYQANP
jgi:hypothetical protein